VLVILADNRKNMCLEKIKTKSELRITGNPVFILGIMPRSGTNYFNNLLLLHPDCEYPGIVWEDYFLAHAELLFNYADSVYKHWQPEWRGKLVDLMGDNPIVRSLGKGLTFFLKEQFDIRKKLGSATRKDPLKLVTATPSVRNLHYFFDLFPDAYLLIIVRDGRSVVESAVKSWDWDYEHTMRNWANAAQIILKFDHTMCSKGKKYLILKYEDLVSHTRKKMTEVLTFLNLDTECYDFAAAENLAVTGSSELRDSEGAIHWQPRKKSENFNPIKRWRCWGKSLHARFNWIAGVYLEQFGYNRQEVPGSEFVWNIWNKILDFIFKLQIKLQQRNGIACLLIKLLRSSLFSTAK
jgi:protein-tyrosine sulfotransferase